MHGEVELRPQLRSQQERPVNDDDYGLRGSLVRSPRRSVPRCVPQGRQIAQRPARPQRHQDFARQPGHVEPAVIPAVRVRPAELEPHRRRPQEVLGADTNRRPAGLPNRSGDRVRNSGRLRARRAVDGNAHRMGKVEAPRPLGDVRRQRGWRHRTYVHAAILPAEEPAARAAAARGHTPAAASMCVVCGPACQPG